MNMEEVIRLEGHVDHYITHTNISISPNSIKNYIELLQPSKWSSSPVLPSPTLILK